MVEKPVTLSIKSKIILVSLFLSLATLFTISMLSYVTADSLIEQRVHSQLASESSGRGSAISLLIDSRIQQVELLAANTDIREIVSAIASRTPGDIGMGAYQTQFDSDIQEFRRVAGDSLVLYDVTLVGRDGKVLISSNETSDAGAVYPYTDRFSRGIRGESFLEFAPVDGIRRAVVTVPLNSESAQDGFSGIMVATMGTE
ncbi:MAG TPA: hypothetical protein VJP79_02335, partial [Nitrososphaera sp.]|nr:hypothetical protein [Nitrososphaera sp.]